MTLSFFRFDLDNGEFLRNVGLNFVSNKRMIYSLSLVFLFLLRLRFPNNISLHEVIRRRYGTEISGILRKLQKFDLKLRKTRLDLKFLFDCRNLELLPKFLHFKLANPQLRKSSAYIRSQRSLLQAEIREKQRKIHTLTKEFQHIENSLRQSLSFLDFIHVSTVSYYYNDKLLIKNSEIHERKLWNLKRQANSVQLDPAKVVHNLSSTTLSDAQLKVLSRGLQFALPPKKLNYADFLCPFERLFRCVSDSKLSFYKGDATLLKTRLKDVALSTYHCFNGQPPPSNIPLTERLALKELQANKTIVIHKADKGNAVVVLDRLDYIAKMQTILSDETKFCQVISGGRKTVFNMIHSLEDKIIRFLRSLHSKQILDPLDYKILYPNGSRPGIMYGLSKVHKRGAPLRPILSATNTATFSLARFIVPMLRSLTENDYTVRDSFHFAKEISGLAAKDLVMASLDVESLFTNIPLDETIQICVDNLPENYIRDGVSTEIPFNKSDMKKALDLCTKEGLFLFNGTYYRQRDGVAMGSPLGPTLANAFLSHHETTWLSNCPADFRPVYYRRYVDDIFVLFQQADHLPRFLEYMNSRHKSMKFTSELELNNQFSFLDILVTRANGAFTTSVYRKPTFSGLYTKFDSFIPDSFKFGLVYSLLHRIYCISSSWHNVDIEIKKLKDIFLKNGYTMGFLDVIVKKFLERIANPRLKIQTVPKKQLLLVLPYLGSLSLQVRNRLLSAFHCLPQVQLRIVFTSNNRIGTILPFKDRIPFSLRSSVVYKFTCATCNSCYYGQTKRHLHTRISEHKGISPLTGKKLSNVNSSVFDHCSTCNQDVNDISEDNFKILCTAKFASELEIKEALFINHDKPILNKQGINNVHQLLLF